MYRYTLSAEAVEALVPPHVRSLCLFAACRQAAGLSPNVVRYVCALAEEFEHVLVLTNQEAGSIANAAALPSNCAACLVPNQCLDFGMYWQVLQHRAKLAGLHRLALVNDSCYVLGSLRALFEWARGRTDGFWGVTRSYEVAPHLQSYFLVFDDRAAVAALLDFCACNDVAPLHGRPKAELVVAMEVGLSRFMAARGFRLDALWDTPALANHSVAPTTNPSFMLWPLLLQAGCPLLKRGRAHVQTDLAHLILELPAGPLGGRGC